VVVFLSSDIETGALPIFMGIDNFEMCCGDGDNGYL
jgi:hypothetical protein